MLAIGFGFWSLWEYYHKVSFDPIRRLIIVNDGVTQLDIREDVYSAWKEWVQLADYTGQAPPAVRTIGGDPTGESLRAGDIYFLINDWKLVVNLNNVRVVGVLFSDDFNTAYYLDPVGAGEREDLLPLFPATVSNLVTTIEIKAQQDFGNIDLSNANIVVNAPTAVEIRQEIDANSSQLQVIRSDTNHIRTVVDAIDSTVDIINIRTNDISSVLSTVNSNIIQIDSSVASIEGTVNNTAAQISLISNSNDVLISDVASINSNLTQVSALVNSTNNTVDNVNNTVLAINNDLSNVSVDISQIKSDIANISLTGGALTTAQATMLLEMYELLGLDPTKPLVVTQTARTAGTIAQTIDTNNTRTIVTRD